MSGRDDFPERMQAAGMLEPGEAFVQVVFGQTGSEFVRLFPPLMLVMGPTHKLRNLALVATDRNLHVVRCNFFTGLVPKELESSHPLGSVRLSHAGRLIKLDGQLLMKRTAMPINEQAAEEVERLVNSAAEAAPGTTADRG